MPLPSHIKQIFPSDFLLFHRWIILIYSQISQVCKKPTRHISSLLSLFTNQSFSFTPTHYVSVSNESFVSPIHYPVITLLPTAMVRPTVTVHDFTRCPSASCQCGIGHTHEDLCSTTACQHSYTSHSSFSPRPRLCSVQRLGSHPRCRHLDRKWKTDVFGRIWGSQIGQLENQSGQLGQIWMHEWRQPACCKGDILQGVEVRELLEVLHFLMLPSILINAQQQGSKLSTWDPTLPHYTWSGSTRITSTHFNIWFWHIATRRNLIALRIVFSWLRSSITASGPQSSLPAHFGYSFQFRIGPHSSYLISRFRLAMYSFDLKL